MQYFFTPAKRLPEGVGFSLFGTAHLLWLAALALMCAAMVIGYKRLAPSCRRRFAKGAALVLVASEIIKDALLAATGGWLWEYLPLHPCSVTMYIILIWAFRPNWACGQYLYGFGVIGALCALLFCNWTSQPIWQFQTIHSFWFHGTLIGFVLMALFSGEIKPEAKGILPCSAILAAGALGTSILNNVLPGCNFFFIKAGSEGSPLAVLIDVFGRPWWLLAYIALAAIVLSAEFLPWYFIRRKEKEE